jgi:hypothetical protein
MHLETPGVGLRLSDKNSYGKQKAYSKHHCDYRQLKSTLSFYDKKNI